MVEAQSGADGLVRKVMLKYKLPNETTLNELHELCKSMPYSCVHIQPLADLRPLKFTVYTSQIGVSSITIRGGEKYVIYDVIL